MPFHTIALDDTVPPDLRREVGDKLAYASDKLRSARLSADGTGVDIVVGKPDELAGAVAKVQDTVRALVHGHREMPTRTIWEHRTTPRHAEPIWDELQRTGQLVSTSPGCVALLGDAARLAHALDRVFGHLARNQFGAVDHQYPTLIAAATLERCDYFASFPHHVTFAPHLRESVDAIRDVASSTAATRDEAIGRALAPPSHLLSPALCFHTYAGLADRPLAAPTVVTVNGRCFRYEGANFASMERLWDFTMRELVFVGDPGWVTDRRRAAIEAVSRVVERLGLDAWIETANDPFFVTMFAAKRYHQLLTEAKFELRLALPYAGTSLAAASFNLHGDFFGRAFQVGRYANGDGFAATGCVGFGIERWVWALFAQHGPALADWPRAVRRVLGV